MAYSPAMNRRTVAPALALGLLASAARADLPPPEGKKQVAYAFQVTGVAANPDWVLLVHPYPVTEGGATRRFAKVEDGKPMRVDRRNGNAKLYAMKKPAFEAWLAKYQAPTDRNADAADALFTSDQVIACDRNPQPVTLVDSSDPRNEVVEAFALRALDGKSCRLDVAAATPAPAPTSAADPSKPAPASGTDPAPAPKHAGCGSCATSSEGSSSSALAWLVGLALAGWRRRR